LQQTRRPAPADGVLQLGLRQRRSRAEHHVHRVEWKIRVRYGIGRRVHARDVPTLRCPGLKSDVACGKHVKQGLAARLCGIDRRLRVRCVEGDYVAVFDVAIGLATLDSNSVR
jgi:hypothetical protein